MYVFGQRLLEGFVGAAYKGDVIAALVMQVLGCFQHEAFHSDRNGGHKAYFFHFQALFALILDAISATMGIIFS